MSDEGYWRYVGGKHGRLGRFKPWWAERVSGWVSIDANNPVSPRRAIVDTRLGPFKTRREAEAAVAEQTKPELDPPSTS